MTSCLRVCEAAAAGGHLAVLQWARQHGCTWDKEVCSSAVGRRAPGNAAMGPPARLPGDEEACSSKAGGSHLAVLQWARQNGCPWDEET
jgi:hypothetical protein